MSKDLYKVLGLNKEASDAEIKRAYRRLAAKYHPDVNKETDAEKKFKEVQLSYEILSDPHKKSQYDQFGTTEQGPGFGGGGGGGYGGFGGFSAEGFDFAGGLGDIFETFFGGGGSSSRKRGPASGRNIEAEVSISFEDSVKGTQKTLKVNAFAKCDTCDGRGMKEGSTMRECGKCKGAGQIFMKRQTPLGYVQTTSACPDCHGQGRVPESPCVSCYGSGRVQKEQKITIDIPAGIFDGGVLRVSGRGEAGERSQRAGDLLVHINVADSREFTRQNDDIHSTVKIHVLQAILGDKISVRTVHGESILKIPNGTQSDQAFRIHEKGMPRLGKSGYGDHIVHVVVEIPKKLNSKEKELYMKVAKEANVEIKSEKGFLDNFKF